MYRRMLVPLDGSELAEVVFPYAKELAARLDLDVVLLHVLKPEERGTAPLHRAYVEHKAEIVESQSEEVRQKAGIEPRRRSLNVRGEVVAGYPAEEILRYADDNEIDLILMATHGRSGIRRWLMGSVADKVLQASKIPVWLVWAGVPEEIVYDKWPRRTILVPLDGSELAETVLPHVEALAKQRGEELVDVVLLQVCEPPAMPDYYPPSARFKTPRGTVHITPAEYMKAAIARSRALAEKYLARVEKRLEGAGLINVRSELLMGEPAQQIANYTNSNPFNLVVMSTHARSGMSQWAYGSVALKVLQGVTSPIFLIRPHQSDSDKPQ